MAPKNTTRRGVAGVVLAAGGGTRFDGPTHKLLAPFRGRPVVSWVLDAVVAAGFDEVYLVTGSVDLSAVTPDGVLVIHATDWADGQAHTLQAAKRQAEKDDLEAMVVGLGDQPMVPTSAWRSVGASAGPIVTAAFDGERRPPVKFHRSVWQHLPLTGDEGARTLFAARPDLVSEIACTGNPFDIDTAEDLARWS
ncbi:MAG: molybdenum cofactor cytidylyltransferase [Acidimicrobiales bacterium]|jgi:molybdenum cofactor cytidylyltransferase